MDARELSKVKIWNILDKQIEVDNSDNKRNSLSERGFSLRPTEASVVSIENGNAFIWGSCHRKIWYRVLDFKQTEPITTKTLYIFKFGNLIEDFITNLFKDSGAFKDGSVKVYDVDTNINGEIDIVIKVPIESEEKYDDDKYVIVEVKSTWGGPATKLFTHYEGRGSNKHLVYPKPKEQNLLQLIIYLYKQKDDPNLVGGKLIYLLRDNFKRTEFDVTLEEQANGKHRASVNGNLITGFYVEDIFDRYQVILDKLDKDIELIKSGTKKVDLIPPERDFTMNHSPEQVEILYESGRISETAYNNYIKSPTNNPSYDWQCSYCSYKTLCYAHEDVINNQGE